MLNILEQKYVLIYPACLSHSACSTGPICPPCPVFAAVKLVSLVKKWNCCISWLTRNAERGCNIVLFACRGWNSTFWKRCSKTESKFNHGFWIHNIIISFKVFICINLNPALSPDIIRAKYNKSKSKNLFKKTTY